MTERTEETKAEPAWRVRARDLNRRADAARRDGYAVVNGVVVLPEALRGPGFHEPVCRVEDYPVGE